MAGVKKPSRMTAKEPAPVVVPPVDVVLNAHDGTLGCWQDVLSKAWNDPRLLSLLTAWAEQITRLPLCVIISGASVSMNYDRLTVCVDVQSEHVDIHHPGPKKQAEECWMDWKSRCWLAGRIPVVCRKVFDSYRVPG